MYFTESSKIFFVFIVFVQVESASPGAEVGTDITPGIGSITFGSEEVEDVIQLQIRADIVRDFSYT